MTTSTVFAPPVAPSSQGTQKAVTGAIRRAEFGDGYSQRAPDGLNFVRRTVTLSWPALVPADCDTIEAFFISQNAGALPFLYTLYNEATQYQWTVASWTKAYVDGDIVSLTATLVQEFDL